ncbi:MAG: redoxin domain-containing protein [Phycisphaera sp.]|nr:redoxin domain-containing protein [Phycisphaera sp.]
MTWPVQRTIVILLALASLGTTALIVLNIARNRHATAGHGATAMQSGGASPTVFDNPIALPAFELTERSGQPVTLETLKGKASVVCFIYTHCAGPCPRITSVMAGLQGQLDKLGTRDHVRLVSISVDPERDTPERLREYAGWAHADGEHWLFLTGPRKDIWALIKDGFKQPVAENPDNTTDPILHTQKLVLVDAEGRIRGFYRALDESLPDGTVVKSQIDELLNDINRLSGK